jgi:hypothetical protein
MATYGNGLGSLAMQKVVGSNPIIRSKLPANVPSLVLPVDNDNQNFVPSGSDYPVRFPRPVRPRAHQRRTIQGLGGFWAFTI